MDESEIRHWLRSGLGRAILYARNHDMRPFKELLLDACLHCYSIDPQTEGTRADFMFDLVNRTPEREFYRDGVLNALRTSGDDWDAKQRFRFAALLAHEGDEQAKQMMYSSYDPGPNMGEAIGIEFVHLDGREGLLLVAEKMGKLLTTTQQNADLGWLMSVSADVLGEAEAKDVLRKGAEQSLFIETYRSAVEGSDANHGTQPDREWIKTATYDQFRAKWPSVLSYYSPRIWGLYATDMELQKAAHGLLVAPDVTMQIAHLKMFWDRPFPLDHDTLLTLAKSTHERVQHAAVVALVHVSSPAVRAFAFDLVRDHAPLRGFAVDLLAHNFHPGDHTIVLEWFEQENEEESLHTEARKLMSFWQSHPDESLYSRMLHGVYERCPCSFCREQAVELLLKRNDLLPALMAECEWDANEDIRELVKGKGELAKN